MYFVVKAKSTFLAILWLEAPEVKPINCIIGMKYDPIPLKEIKKLNHYLPVHGKVKSAVDKPIS